MGHSPPPKKNSEFASFETTGPIGEKSRESKNGTDTIFLQSLHGGVRKKSWEFLFFNCHTLDLELEYTIITPEI